jgi:AraC-like DNA-binding protein
MGAEHRMSGLRTPRFQSVSTDLAAPRERFDFWSSMFGGADMSPMGKPGGQPYSATALSCAGEDGVGLTRITCDPTASRFNEGAADGMLLTVFARGRLEVSHGPDARTIIGAGPSFHLFDCERDFSADAPEGHDSFHITLSRATALAAMGGEPIPGREAFLTLPDTPLSLVIKSQLQILCDHAQVIDAQDCDAAMRALSDLVSAYLGRFARREADGTGASGDALFAAACALIEARKGRSGLTADILAFALKCSRATLYRVFAQRGLSVGEHVRRVRLRYGRSLLRDPSLDIGDVALQCGYSDLSAFGKAFRREFKLTPSEWRMDVTSIS